MRKAHLTLLVAAALLSTAAQASVILRAAPSVGLDDLRIISTGGQVALRAGGDVRLGTGLDPNRVQVNQAGGLVMSVRFQASGAISASQLNPGSALPASSASTGGSISGAFFGPAGASSGVIDVTLSGSSSSGSTRYAKPFLVPSAAGVVTPVPEPSSWVLMLAGATGLAGFVSVQARRRT